MILAEGVEPSWSETPPVRRSLYHKVTWFIVEVLYFHSRDHLGLPRPEPSLGREKRLSPAYLSSDLLTRLTHGVFKGTAVVILFFFLFVIFPLFFLTGHNPRSSQTKLNTKFDLSKRRERLILSPTHPPHHHHLPSQTTSVRWGLPSLAWALFSLFQ